MSESVVAAHEGAVFKEIVDALARNRISSVPVIDDRRRVVGVVADSDLLARLAGYPGTPRGHWLPRSGSRRKVHAATARELMTAPVVATTAQTRISDAARRALRAGWIAPSWWPSSWRTSGLWTASWTSRTG